MIIDIMDGFPMRETMSKKRNNDDFLVCDYERADNGNDVQVGLRA